MIGFILFFTLISSSLCKGVPWYPVPVPIHTGGHHHRHTTHIVTHPVTHTRVLFLGDDDHHHGHNHLHKHGLQHSHVHHRTSSHHQEFRQSSRSPKLAKDDLYRLNPNYKYYEPYKGGRHAATKEKYTDPSPKYSYPISESPWKPLTHYPKGYLPLKYLGIDVERVSEVVRDALVEMERDEKKPIPLSPIGARHQYRPESITTRLHSGAVFYDDFDVLVKPLDTQARHGGAGNALDRGLRQGNSNAIKLNVECDCEDHET